MCAALSTGNRHVASYSECLLLAFVEGIIVIRESTIPSKARTPARSSGPDGEPAGALEPVATVLPVRLSPRRRQVAQHAAHDVTEVLELLAERLHKRGDCLLECSLALRAKAALDVNYQALSGSEEALDDAVYAAYGDLPLGGEA